MDSERDSVGYVAKIDTTSLQVVATCKVGYQPEEMAITNEKLYVANSGCCREPDYDHTISVVDLYLFQEIRKIDVAPNLHRMELDPYGNLWVSSRGDYYDIKSMLFVIDTYSDYVIDQLDMLPCSDMTICGDSLYVLANVWSNFTEGSEVSYGIVDLTTRQIVSRSFISDGTDDQFQNPYGIAVNPQTREIF
ncbi:MAG: YncE family protein, partial [Paludibacteraceae bacterium]|nr:YncE family protein [Paludibacteraceae bacterium]